MMFKSNMEDNFENLDKNCWVQRSDTDMLFTLLPFCNYKWTKRKHLVEWEAFKVNVALQKENKYVYFWRFFKIHVKMLQQKVSLLVCFFK